MIKKSIRQTVMVAFATCLLAAGVNAVAQDDSVPAADAGPAGASSIADATAPGRAESRRLDMEVQALKNEVLDLNRDLFLLEEDLLFPANSQVAFFVSVDVGEYFALDSVNLKIDGKEVSNYLYTPSEVDALSRGGVHRIHMANLKTGEHELTAVFIGKGPHDREYRRGASVTIDKGIGAKYVELEITDRVRKQQPEFLIKDWE